MSTTPTGLHYAHIALLDYWSSKRLVWLEQGLNLMDEDDQYVFLDRIERHPDFVPEGASAVDVAIEYLLTRRRLMVQEISSALRLHDQCTRARLIHLAKVAHDRLKHLHGRVPAVRMEVAA